LGLGKKQKTRKTYPHRHTSIGVRPNENAAILSSELVGMKKMLDVEERLLSPFYWGPTQTTERKSTV
jgi:hypothetical protein